MEIVIKTIYDTAPAVIGIWTNKTKDTWEQTTYEFFFERVPDIFSAI